MAVYGLVGLKTHAKMDGADLASRRQCHPALCAYRHRQLARTPPASTPISIVTAHREIGRDVAAIFIT